MMGTNWKYDAPRNVTDVTDMCVVIIVLKIAFNNFLDIFLIFCRQRGQNMNRKKNQWTGSMQSDENSAEKQAKKKKVVSDVTDVTDDDPCDVEYTPQKKSRGRPRKRKNMNQTDSANISQ